MKTLLIAGLALLPTLALADEKPIPPSSIIATQASGALCFDHGQAYSVGAMLDGRMCQAQPGQMTLWVAAPSVVRLKAAATPSCGPEAPATVVTITGPLGFSSSYTESPPACHQIMSLAAITTAYEVLKFGVMIIPETPYIARGAFQVVRFGVKMFL